MEGLNKYINESIAASLLSQIIPMGVGLLVGWIIMCFVNRDLRENIKENIKYIKSVWEDKKAQKIIKKLAEDPEIKEFFELSRYKQKGKWIELLKSKLTEDEYKYIKYITKDKMRIAIN